MMNLPAYVFNTMHTFAPNAANAEKQPNFGCFPASGTFNINVREKNRHQEVGLDTNKSKRIFQIIKRFSRTSSEFLVSFT